METFVTAVLGASPNKIRYSNIAVNRLEYHEFPLIALGFRKGQIGNSTILTDWPKVINDLKVLTLYIGTERQPEYYDYIIGLKPETVIFNPGTENPELYELLMQSGIKFEEACTLVLLGTGAYKNL